MAETAKRKLSVSLSDKWKDPEYIAKQKIKDESRRKGYNSWRENMSDDDKAELYSRMSMAQKGKPKSEEHKAKLRGKRAPWSDERKGAFHSNESSKIQENCRFKTYLTYLTNRGNQFTDC